MLLILVIGSRSRQPDVRLWHYVPEAIIIQSAPLCRDRDVARIYQMSRVLSKSYQKPSPLGLQLAVHSKECSYACGATSLKQPTTFVTEVVLLTKFGNWKRRSTQNYWLLRRRPASQYDNVGAISELQTPSVCQKKAFNVHEAIELEGFEAFKYLAI
jgi:hypothetical protein